MNKWEHPVEEAPEEFGFKRVFFEICLIGLSSGCGFKILSFVFFIFFLFFKFYFIFKLYITVLVLPNIKMNPPQVCHLYVEPKT